MLLPLLSIVLLTCSHTLATFSCRKIYSEFSETQCKCDESFDFFNLTCKIENDHIIEILLQPLDNKFEINCKGHNIKNTSFIPKLIDHQIDQVEYFGFTNCSLLQFNNLMFKMIETKRMKMMALRKISNMTSSEISTLLQGTQINSLYILASPLTDLPENLLYNIEDLKEIFINHNKITTLPEGFFKNSKQLHTIDLGSNNLMNIPENLFSDVKSLISLRLFSNNLSSIEANIFTGLENLKELELMTNKLSSLKSNVFQHLPKLRSVSLRKNLFHSLPIGLFKNNSNLEIIRLNNNAFLTTLPDELFANLTKLEELQISYCNLTHISENVFLNTTNLKKLTLDYNKLKRLSQNLFKDTTKLIELNLEQNELEILEEGIFRKLSNLKVLKLGYNRLQILDDTFLGLKGLLKLYIPYNELDNLTKNSLKHFQNLTILDMSHNKLTLEPQHFIGQRFSILPALGKLEILHLQHNKIPYIFTDWVVVSESLKDLNLAYNNISSLEYSQLQFIQAHTIKVNLEHNKIKTINLSSAETLITFNKNNVPPKERIILLNGNPINCDCRIYDLVRYIDGKMHEDVRKVLHLDVSEIRCTNETQKYKGTLLTNLKSDTLTCVLEDGPKLPNDCIKQHYEFRLSNKRLIMNCSYSGITAMPHIELNGSDFKSFDIEILLKGNNITTLSKPFGRYENVVELDLSHNNIAEITWIPPKIEVLKLNDNNLTYLTCDELSLINNVTIKNLTFHNNQWKCDCNLFNFTKYLQENFKKVSNLHNIKCNEEGIRRELTRISLEDLCPNTQQLLTVICASLAFMGLIVAIAVPFYFRYKQHIKVWLYARNLCLYLITENELDQDKIYDAFISFSHEDEDFVVNELLPGLENGSHPFRLCVHYRDWQPGEFITANIARSIDESRRTVVVLSKGFLQSEWGRMEFRTAHTEALKEGRARVIVIVYGDIGPVDDLDAELRAYLTTNTYVKWGTPWFWDNLRYALPHSSKSLLPPNNTAAVTCKQPEKIIRQYDEKADLIYEPSTPPASTTPPAESLQHMQAPLLHSALNVSLIGDTLINSASDKPPNNLYDIEVKTIV